MPRPEVQLGNRQITAGPEAGKEGKTLHAFLEEHGLLKRVKEMVPDTSLNVALTPGEIAELANLLKEENESAVAVMMLSMYIRQRIMNSRLRQMLRVAQEIGEAVRERQIGPLLKIIAGLRERFLPHIGQEARENEPESADR